MSFTQSSSTSHYTWRHLERGTTTSDDLGEKAKAAFHLIKPRAAPEWPTYLTQRDASEANLDKLLGSSDFDEMKPGLDQRKIHPHHEAAATIHGCTVCENALKQTNRRNGCTGT